MRGFETSKKAIFREEINYDFSTWGKDYWLFSDKNKKLASLLYETNLKALNTRYLDELIELYDPSISSIKDVLLFGFKEGVQAKLLAAKTAKYDLENGIYRLSKDGIVEPLAPLKTRLNKQEFDNIYKNHLNNLAGKNYF